MAANGEENEIQLREMDEEALDKPELVSSVANMLAEIGGNPADDELNAAPTQKQDDGVIDDDEGEPDADDDVEGGEPTPEEKEGKDEEEFDLPELPDSYYRSAARNGWTPEVIAEMVTDIGIEKVTTLLSNIHKADNNMTNTFSDLGRKAKELDGRNAPPDITGEGEGKSTEFKVEMEALVEKYGEDDPLVIMYAQQGQSLKELQESFKELNANLSLTQSEVSQQEQRLEEQTRKSVNGFFDGKGMEPFAKFYGNLDKVDDTWDGLARGQKANRDAVCVEADRILVGAQMHGDKMSLDEAMERAHMIISEPIAESIVRTKIMKSVEKRSKARVVRPSSGKAKSKTSDATGGKPANKQELVDRTNERLSTLFKGLRN